MIILLTTDNRFIFRGQISPPEMSLNVGTNQTIPSFYGHIHIIYQSPNDHLIGELD